MGKVISHSTVSRLGIVLFFSLLVFSGCKKEPDDNPDEDPAPTPTLTASAVPDSVVFGGSSKVSYNSKNLDSLTMNSEKVSFSGNFTLDNLQEDVSLVFVGYYSVTDGETKANVTKTLKETVKISVGDYVPPPLHIVELEVTDENGNSVDTIQLEWGGRAVFYVTVINADSVATDYSGLGSLDVWSRINDSTKISGGTTNEIFETTTYHFWAYGESGVVSDSITIYIPPLSTNMQLLTAHAWSVDSLWYKTYEDDEWEYSQPSEEYKTFWHIFWPNGYTESYKPPGILINNSWWSFSNDETIINWGDEWHIAILNNSTLKIWTKVPCLGCEVDSSFMMENYIVH